MKRLFRNLPIRKESFLKESLFGDVKVSTEVSVNNTRQESNESNTVINKIINSQDILNSVNSAYDKSIEVLNKISHEVNKSSEAISSAKTVQSNVINLSGAKLTGIKISVSQTNKALINVALTATLQSINEMSTDNKTKAIVADMLGVTQGSEAMQTAIQSAAQTAETLQQSKQETEQTEETFAHRFLKERLCFIGCVGVSTSVSVQNINQINNLSNYSDNLQDNSIRNQSIQNYATSLSEKMNNEQEYVDNIKQTIQAVSDEAQNNVLDMSGLEADDVVLEFNQVNELTSDVVNGFEELIKDVKSVATSTDTDVTGEISAEQHSSSGQTGGQTSDQSAKADQSAIQTTIQTIISMLVAIVVAIVAVIAFGIIMKVIISKNKNGENENVNENAKNN
jgi:hypothetical protein